MIAFADSKLNATMTLKFVFQVVKNFVENGENAGYLHILLFPQCFRKASYSGKLKLKIVW